MAEENKLVTTIKKVMPSVVSIGVAKSAESLEKEIPPEYLPYVPFEHGHIKIPDEMKDARGMVNVGGGSGFIVDKKGIVVTNKHVVADKEADYTVLTNDGKKYPATVLARDPIDDVAIVQINNPATPLQIIALGDSTDLQLGETVLAIGNALGIFKNTVSSGIISGLSRSIQANSEMNQKTAPQELRGLIQTDAAINPGNSGGPLVNLNGEAIGINAAIVFGAQNLGFAIPMNAAKRDLEDLRAHGRIRRPLLGLRYINIDENLKARMKLPVDKGALVMGHPQQAPAIIPGSPAAKARFRERDIVIACNGEALTPEKTIQDFLEEKEVGDILHLKVLRGKRELDLKVVLAERR